MRIDRWICWTGQAADAVAVTSISGWKYIYATNILNTNIGIYLFYISTILPNNIFIFTTTRQTLFLKLLQFLLPYY